jgi:hypothetical protein
MDSTVKRKLPYTAASYGLSRIQHLNMKWLNFEFTNSLRCVHTAVIIEPPMGHSSVIPWKATFGPQVIESVCAKQKKKKQRAELYKIEF